MKSAGGTQLVQSPDGGDQRLHVDGCDDEVGVAADRSSVTKGVHEELQNRLASGLTPAEEVGAQDQVVVEHLPDSSLSHGLRLAVVREGLERVVLGVATSIASEDGVGGDGDEACTHDGRLGGDGSSRNDVDGECLLGVDGAGLVPGDGGRVEDHVGPDLADGRGDPAGVAQVGGDDAGVDSGSRRRAGLPYEGRSTLQSDADVGAEEAPGARHEPRLHGL